MCPHSPQLAYKYSKLQDKRSSFDDVNSIIHCFLLRVSVVFEVILYLGKNGKWIIIPVLGFIFIFYVTQILVLVSSSLVSSISQEKVIQTINFD